jgi:hypothetical protein
VRSGTRRIFLALGCAIASAALVGGLYLNVTSQGLLLRADPMFVDDRGVIEHMACVYYSALKSETVYVIHNREGAECAEIYKFGSIPLCVGYPHLTPGMCSWAH